MRLLDEYDYPVGGIASQRYEADWVKDVQAKIAAATEASNHTAPIDGETFVDEILERFQQAN